jgi:hypothetical protein
MEPKTFTKALNTVYMAGYVNIDPGDGRCVAVRKATIHRLKSAFFECLRTVIDNRKRNIIPPLIANVNKGSGGKSGLDRFFLDESWHWDTL